MKTLWVGMAVLGAMVAGQVASAEAKQPDWALHERCSEQINPLVRGLQMMWPNNKVLGLSLESETEVREYRVSFDSDGSIEDYKIVLSNDSASRCLLLSVELMQSGG